MLIWGYVSMLCNLEMSTQWLRSRHSAVQIALGIDLPLKMLYPHCKHMSQKFSWTNNNLIMHFAVCTALHLTDCTKWSIAAPAPPLPLPSLSMPMQVSFYSESQTGVSLFISKPCRRTEKVEDLAQRSNNYLK